jgi:ketosteroid isomerase-like protein
MRAAPAGPTPGLPSHLIAPFTNELVEAFVRLGLQFIISPDRASGLGEQPVILGDMMSIKLLLPLAPRHMVHASCGRQSAEAVFRKVERMSDNPNLRIQEQFVTAVLAGDVETIRALCAPEFRLHEGSGMPFSSTYTGADGFMEFLGAFNETFDIEYLTPVRVFATDDPGWLIGELDFRAKLRADGSLFETSILEMWHFKDGKVVSIKPHYFNAV